MNRPLHVWTVFALCSAVLLGVMGWVSYTTLRLERLQLEAARQAELEERARLALWRMDSWLAPLIIGESARPAAAYETFQETLRDNAKGDARGKPGKPLAPSPMFGYASSNILLHFQLFPGGRLTSPQAPDRNQLELPERAYVYPGQVEAAAQRLAAFRKVLDQPAPAGADASSSPGKSLPSFSSTAQTALEGNNRDLLVRQTELPLTNIPVAALPTVQMNQQQALNAPAQMSQPAARMAQVQEFRNQAEFNFRANTFQQAQQRLSLDNMSPPPLTPQSPAPLQPKAGESQVMFKALWLGDALVLARRIDHGKSFVIQGCWLNWTNVQTDLLVSIKDLFPAARLLPLRDTNGERNARMLATLPVKLLTGPVATKPLPGWTLLRFSLLIAWVCVLVAGLAVAMLLQGALSLSERRASFVSAVTHELRTPLTTFKMYSEMLAGDMVPDAARRKLYLNTLCLEADRLGHLVENVLAYARLERGSARSRVERIPLIELVKRVKPRLAQRAEQAGMALVEELGEAARETLVRVDAAAVEQILFNLVDNACKYAAPSATCKTIHLEALPEQGGFAMLRVRDHGPGISAEAARRLFKPFSKSAQQAAQTAPGVGLGLALCRRLSRGMGGELRLSDDQLGGASFVLLLPLHAG
ncbi:MAG: HAMP domain-containing histidine kinase [Candidatus Omnitrophica bacterium]|nr:HAMP domain-containing histidine kinase [Candidatus Omnitrophota bacterium]